MVGYICACALFADARKPSEEKRSQHPLSNKGAAMLDARMADLERTLLNVVLCGIIRGQWGRYNVREQDGQTDG
eukprot:scaffold52749_cov94-Cyclotella_meneghiniana.AAC.2